MSWSGVNVKILSYQQSSHLGDVIQVKNELEEHWFHLVIFFSFTPSPSRTASINYDLTQDQETQHMFDITRLRQWCSFLYSTATGTKNNIIVHQIVYGFTVNNFLLLSLWNDSMVSQVSFFFSFVIQTL